MNFSSLARTLGRRGGRSRAKRLSFERKKEIASLGGHSRSRSLTYAKRILTNFRYLETIRVMRGESTLIKHENNFSGKLPGLYAKKQKKIRS